MIVTVTLNPAIDQTVQVPHLQVGAVNTVRDLVETPGGKGINVARVLADLEQPVAATGFMGSHSQPLFDEYFSAHGIQGQFVTLEGTVRSNIKVVNQSDTEVTDINFPGFQAKDEWLNDVLSTLSEHPADTLIAVCGSLPPGISLDAYATFLQSLKTKGYALAVDNSGSALKQAIRVKPDIIKPNIHELSALAGTVLTEEEALSFSRQLAEQGVGLVVLSWGARGAWFITRDQCLHARPATTKVVSTVGAGDSMLAGCLYGQEKHYSLQKTARLATACGMQAVAQAGVGCSMEELNKLMAAVEVS